METFNYIMLIESTPLRPVRRTANMSITASLQTEILCRRNVRFMNVCNISRVIKYNAGL